MPGALADPLLQDAYADGTGQMLAAVKRVHMDGIQPDVVPVQDP